MKIGALYLELRKKNPCRVHINVVILVCTKKVVALSGLLKKAGN